MYGGVCNTGIFHLLVAPKRLIKGSRLGTPNREPQEYGRNMIGTQLPGSLYSKLYPYCILGVPYLGFRCKSLC